MVDHALDHDPLHGRDRVPIAFGAFVGDVRSLVCVDRRSLDRLLNIAHDGKRVIFHLDQLGSVDRGGR